MKRIKDFAINKSIIKRLDTASPLKGTWVHNSEEGSVVADLEELDSYLLMNLGFSSVNERISENFDSYVRTTLNSNEYKLNGLWQSINFEYNPIDNYDRTETQTHNEKIDTGNHTTTVNVGSRTQTNTNGAFTDTTTSESDTTSFDSNEYEKPTDKNTSTFNKGGSTDSINTSATTDTTTQQGYTDNSSGGYTLRARGNIGTMATQTMIEMNRKIVDYCFFDEILKLFEKYITEMVYDF